MADKSGKRGGPTDTYQLELVGLKAGEQRPDVVLQALDRKRTVIYTQDVGKDGSFALPADVLKNAHLVVLGVTGDDGALASETTTTYRAAEFARSIIGGTLALAEGIWSRWPVFFTCVSGTVRVCRRRPWWYDSIFVAATNVATRLQTTAVTRASTSFSQSALLTFNPSLNDLLVWPFRCDVVCLGTVEVYRRTCCCSPLIIDDLRIDDLIRDLTIVVERTPKFPPGPPIDPLKTPFFKGGALNEFALNATSDLAILRSLPRDQAAMYINSRPYLIHRLCFCGTPAKVATGTIQPDGTFNVCFRDFRHILFPNCYDQYAYVVKQTIGLTTTTIYDGLTAGAWYAAGDAPVLTSYNYRAFSCGETGTPAAGAYVFLDLIGDTESHELVTPDSTSWGSVAAPDATSGLLFLNPDPAPQNRGHLRNLGGAIELTYNFSEGMKDPAVGAVYYRLSISQADSSGNPTGARLFHGDGLSWQKVVGPDIVPETLGPFTVGTESNLFKIPYNSDAAWTGAGRYHARINTTIAALNLPIASDLASTALNHLITLEVFNAAGERLRPLVSDSASDPGELPGTEVTRPFEFRRWFQPGGSVGDDTKVVPFAALTHLFCWDNRAPEADITRLVKNGVASGEECQFLVGQNGSTFGIEYRAYVPDERFQYGHAISWLRGLNGSSANGGAGSLPTPLSPTNVGKPPALPANSGTNTFQQMLTRIDPITGIVTVLDKCSFAVTLTTHSKTTDGEYFGYPHDEETAAFALEIE
ncbi:MAG: hypothetical protein ACT4P7_04805 [Gemmatimonadaceae bacterium]